MSWKGFKKAVARMPASIGKATGNMNETKDEEYQAYQEQFDLLQVLAKKLAQDAKIFKDSLSMMLTHQIQMAECFLEMFKNIDPNPSQLEIQQTIVSEKFAVGLRETRDVLAQDLEQIERLVVAPTNDYIILLEQVKKVMTKRAHKLLDFDRHRQNVDKLKQKPNRTISDEKSMAQLENSLDVATRDFNNLNNLLKQELPIFLGLRVDFIDPCLLTLYNYQTKVYHSLYTNFYQAAADHFDLNTTALMSFEAHIQQMTSLLDGLSVPKRSGNNSEQPAEHAPPSYSENTKEVSRAPTLKSSAPIPMHVPVSAPSKSENNTVVALYDFEAQAPGDLSFSKGDHIEIVERKDDVNDWWIGKFNGKTGQFPGIKI